MNLIELHNVEYRSDFNVNVISLSSKKGRSDQDSQYNPVSFTTRPQSRPVTSQLCFHTHYWRERTAADFDFILNWQLQHTIISQVNLHVFFLLLFCFGFDVLEPLVKK